MNSMLSTYESCIYYEQMKGLIELGVESECRHSLGPTDICEECPFNLKTSLKPYFSAHLF